MILYFQTLECCCYRSNHWNSDLILQKLEFCCYPSKPWNSRPINKLRDSHLILSNIGILSFSFQTLEFWAYFYTHRFSYPILSNSGILALFVLALELLSYPCNTVILILSFQTLEFWPCPYKPWNYDLFFQKNIGLLTLFLWTSDF